MDGHTMGIQLGLLMKSDTEERERQMRALPSGSLIRFLCTEFIVNIDGLFRPLHNVCELESAYMPYDQYQ